MLLKPPNLKRRLLVLLTVALVILSLAILILTVRSYWTADIYTNRHWTPISNAASSLTVHETSWEFVLEKSGVSIMLFLRDEINPSPRFTPVKETRTSNWHSEVASHGASRMGNGNLAVDVLAFVGFAYGYRADTGGSGNWSYHDSTTRLHFSTWWLLLVLIMTTGLLTRKILKADRQGKLNQCSHCGYDLTASPKSCPECGKPTRRNKDVIAQPHQSASKP